MRLWMRAAGDGIYMPANGRDTSQRAHRFRRDSDLQRLPHRYRLPLPLQGIITLQKLQFIIKNYSKLLETANYANYANLCIIVICLICLIRRYKK